MSRLAVCSLVASLGPLGRLPAPGTWGSGVGLVVGLALVETCPTSFLWFLIIITFPCCALICSQAERYFDRHDPPPVILDEVWAMATVLMVLAGLIGSSSRVVVLAFLLFRLFDILKPPPLQRLARLPRGWGIMADDAGAAVYTCAILWLVRYMTHFRF